MGNKNKTIQKKNKKKQNKRFLIDGFPRNFENLEKWNQLMSEIVDFQSILFLDCSEELMC